ncbi:hypothetical protein E4U61_004681 [Claviceps capensis]|nr:hypothetical protein E4U61_004681 [Claviceps capensis]
MAHVRIFAKFGKRGYNSHTANPRAYCHGPTVAFASGFRRSIDLETETMKVTTPAVTAEAEAAKDRETTRTTQESDINTRKLFHYHRKRVMMVADNLKKRKVAQSELKW